LLGGDDYEKELLYDCDDVFRIVDGSIVIADFYLHSDK